jgi:hypothetical protein
MKIVHTMPMRKVLATTIAATAILATPIAISPLHADETPLPAPSTSPLTPFEQFRIDRENYFAAMKVITNNFKVACDAANLNYANALAQAKNKDQKRVARLARESSIAAATIEFESAKNALGPMPVEPLKAAKFGAKSKAKLR